MFNPIKWYKNKQLDKLQIKIEMFSSLIDEKFWCNDLGSNADGFWKKDFTWRTENYKFVHKEVNWNIIHQLVWIVIPKTVDNSRSLAAHSKLHHGFHPNDWIIKNAKGYYMSYPPERLRKEILTELIKDLVNRPKNPKLLEKRVNTIYIEPEPINSRFEIMDL